MALKRKRYTVALYTPDGIVEHEIEAGPGDQLKAEQAGVRQGLLPNGIEANPLVFGCLVVYYAMVRTGLYDGKFQTFMDVDCYEFERVEDDPATDDAVDPTPGAALPGSASTSPLTLAGDPITG